MENTNILSIYEKEKALKKGHFILSSGKRSSIYLQSAIVLSNPIYLNLIGKLIIEKIDNILNKKEIDLVVSPAMGGIIIGTKVGELLNKRSIFLERVDRKFSLRRGFEIKRNEKILIVEDVVTTGKSSFESAECISKSGVIIVGLASIIDRSSQPISFDFPYASICHIDAPIFTEENIPFELQNIPAVKPGSRFLKK